jgi:photosystem II stability/assembly factor-like uncharacterized protein
MFRGNGLRAALVVVGVLAAGGRAHAGAGWTALPALGGDEGVVTAVWGRAAGDATFVTQGGQLVHTSDGGKSFTHVKLDARDTSAVYDAGGDVYVLGPGVIYHSADRKSWTASRILDAPGLHGIWGGAADDVWAVGDHGTILHSGDHGATWTASPSGSGSALTAVWGWGRSLVVAGANGTLLRSGNGGKSFTTELSGISGTLRSVWGASAADVWVVGDAGVLLHGDGRAWARTPLPVGVAGVTLTAVWGTSARDVYAAGGGGVILHYDGKVWAQQKTGTAGTLRALGGSGPYDVWAVGDEILHSTAGPEVGELAAPPGGTTAAAAAAPGPPRPAPPTAPPGWSALETGAGAPLAAASSLPGSLFVVGAHGVVLQSGDDGQSFTTVVCPVDVDLHAVWRPSRSDVWVAGDRGKILHSTDEGQSWSEVPLGVDSAIYGMWGSSASDIYLVGQGGTILHTPDGGRSWRVAATGITADLRSVWGAGKNDVYIAGDGATLLRTTNGGAAFARVKLPAGTSYKAVWGSSAHDVWVAGDAVLHTTDGGKSWKAVTLAGGRGFSAERVIGAGAEVAAVGSAAGTAAALSGGPAVWKSDALGPAAHASDAWFVGSSLYVLAGTSVYLRGARPTPGAVWGRQQVAEGAILNRVWGSGADDVYVVGDKGFIARSTDAGHSWATLTSGTTENLNGVWGSGPGDVYAVGQHGTVLHSQDRGATWTAEKLGTQDHLNSVWGTGPGDVYAVGTQGATLGGIFHSTDGGKSWVALMGGGRTFWGVWGTSASNVYVVAWDGAYGVILRSDNGGKNWSPVHTGDKPYPYLTGIWGSSADDLYAVGFGVILHSRDGGKSWSASEHATGPGSAGYGGIWGTGPGDVYLTADGYVFHSTDGGATWPELRSPMIKTGAVWGSGPGDVYVLGDGEVYHLKAR